MGSTLEGSGSGFILSVNRLVESTSFPRYELSQEILVPTLT